MKSGRIGGIVLWLFGLLLVCGCGAGATRPARRAASTGREQPRTTTAISRTVRPIDPARFSPGACVAFAPTVVPRHLTVFLDAGHGGRDPGAVGRTASGRPVHEAAETLAVELDTMAILRAAGFQVVVSHTHDTSVLRLGPDDMAGAALTPEGSHEDVLARAVCANEARASLLVGIYFNAGAPSNGGAVTGYDAVRPFAAENLRLARLLEDDVLSAMNARGWGIPDAGVKPDAGLGSALTGQALSYGHLVLLGPFRRGYVPTPSQMPGALVEPLFITDPFEGSIAASPDGQEVIAGGLAKAVEQYLAPASW